MENCGAVNIMQEHVEYEDNIKNRTANTKIKWTKGKKIALIVITLVVIAVAVVIIVNNTSGVLRPYDYIKTPVFEGNNGYGMMVYNEGRFSTSEEKFMQYMTSYRAGDVRFKPEYEEGGTRWLQDNGYPTLMDLIMSYLLEDYSVTTPYGGIPVRTCSGYAIESTPKSGLSNGDKVVLSWTFNGREDEFRYLEKCIDFNIDTSDVVLTVSGLQETQHVQSPNQISEEYIEYLQEFCCNNFNDYVDSEWDPVEKQLLSLEYNGYVLAVSKITSANELVLAFKGNAQFISCGETDNSDFWIYYKFDNIDNLENGNNYVDTGDFRSPCLYSTAQHGKLTMWSIRCGEDFSHNINNVIFTYPGYETESEIWDAQLSEYADICSFWRVSKDGTVLNYIDGI